MSDKTQIPLQKLRSWLEQETGSLVEPIKVEAQSILANLESRFEEVRETCNKLLVNAEKEIAKDSGKTYRRAKAMAKLAEEFAEMVSKISFPEIISQKNLKLFNGEIAKMLETLQMERAKWFPIISPYFIMDRRRFDSTLKRSLDQVRELDNFLTNKYNTAETVEKTFALIEQTRNFVSDLNKVNLRQNEMKNTLLTLEKREDVIKHEILSIQSKNELVELEQLAEKIESLQNKIHSNLRYLQKPLRKFQNLVQDSTSKLAPNELEKLDEYLNDPFVAIATEKTGYPTLKRILDEIEEVLLQGKLKLKSRRLIKAKQQMKNLRENSLFKIQQNCNAVLIRKRELLTSKKTTRSQTELKKLRKELANVIKQKNARARSMKNMDERRMSLCSAVEERKKELEKTILELLNSEVQISI